MQACPHVFWVDTMPPLLRPYVAAEPDADERTGGLGVPIELSGRIPTQAKVDNTAKVAAVYDKGKGALVVVEAQTRDESGRPLFVNRFAAFLRGEGGFGGEPGPAPGNEPPARSPDHVVESPTLPQQALLYRLSGDKNPLHIDPSFAKLGGFDAPILHGLCSYGIVCKAAVDGALGGTSPPSPATGPASPASCSRARRSSRRCGRRAGASSSPLEPRNVTRR